MGHNYVKCSKCHELTQADFPYCNHCGAKLENVTVESETDEENEISITDREPDIIPKQTLTTQANDAGALDPKTIEEYKRIVCQKRNLLLKIFVPIVLVASICITLILFFVFKESYKGDVGQTIGTFMFCIGTSSGISAIIIAILWKPMEKYSIAIQKYEEFIVNQRNQEAKEKEMWKQNNIKKTVIVHTSSKQDTGSTIARGVAGAWLAGDAGAIVGASTGKMNNFTTFLIIYSDESRETREVQNGTELYNLYIKYLEV